MLKIKSNSYLFFIVVSYFSTTTFEISSFLKFVEDMPQEDFKRKTVFLSNSYQVVY